MHQFLRVCLQVKEFTVFGIAIDGDLVALGDERAQMDRGRVVPVLDQHVVACRRSAPAPHVELIDALHDARRRDARRSQEGLRIVDQALERVRHLAGRHLPGLAHDHGHAQHVLVVKRPLGDQAVLAQEVAVVGGEDDERVVGNAGGIERVEDAPDLVVDEAHHAVVGGQAAPDLLVAVQVRVEAVQPLPARLGVVGEVGAASRVRANWGGMSGKLAVDEAARLHVGRVVHAGPRFGHDVGRMRVEEAGPEEEGLVLLHALLDVGNRALADPVGVVELLGQIPVQRVAHVVGAGVLVVRIGRPLLEIVAPVGQPLLLHPERVVLAGVRLVGVHARRLHMVEAVPGAVKVAPEVQVAQDRLALDGLAARLRLERLEVRLADQDRAIAVGLEHVAHRGNVLRQLDADRPAAMPGRVHPRNQRGARRRAGRVRAIGAGEARALTRQPVERRRLQHRVGHAERRVMLLVGGDKKDVRA